MKRKIVKVNFIDKDNEDLENNVEVQYIQINGDYAAKIIPMYKIWYKVWTYVYNSNGIIQGWGYAEYKRVTGERSDFIEQNFTKLVNLALHCNWSVEGFLKVLNTFFPEANATLIKVDDEVDLEW